ncbi:hypothetical protein [Nocardia sp. NBC_01327]|uniref:hypothetical protein n=1 Tax=Nocardia sp. NBC_01327 TaxID=2903593 RepID=UPI002E15F6FE|nr:hypothetical protein OG326_42425 [Nocardia sp. NBC_01327]
MTGNTTGTLPADQTVEEIFAEVTTTCGPIFEQIGWAEEEIQAAQARYPAHADEIWHSFSLLQHEHPLMNNEPVYRAHCREILTRIGTGHGRGTRAGTAVEVLIVLRKVSLAVPLSTAAAGLYFRMWQAAGLPEIDPEGHTADLSHYDAIAGSQIDDYEREVRARTARMGRLLSRDLRCCGRHHGDPVRCRYTAEPAPAATQFASASAAGPAEQLTLI